MNCEELRGEYGAWTLGIAEDPARSEIAAHLARECPECVAGIRSAMATTAAFSGAVTEVDPPRHLRRRVIAMVEPQPKRAVVILPWAVSALLAVALISVAIPGRQTKTEDRDVSKLAEALSILNDPVAKDVTFGDPAARGRVFVSPKGVVLIAAHLPKLDASRTFELWIIPGTGNPIPAGTFHGEAISSAPGAMDTSAVYVYQGQTANAAAIAVTVEPEGGSPQPTTTPFIVSKL